MSTVHVLRVVALVSACAVAAPLFYVGTGRAAEEGDAGAAPLTPGEEVFRDSCSICHSIENGAPTIVAPNLFGVVGRQSATQDDYFYSSAMRAANLSWDEVTLSAFLTSPQQVVPGTSMGFLGFLDPGDTQNVIAYLKAQR
nr:MAG: c-type cytochrome [Hyphomicrobiales bacterium]